MTFWNHEQEALREAVRTFVAREITPNLQDWEDAGSLPRSLHEAAAKQGLLGIGVPEEHGGDGGGVLDQLAAQEAFFEAGASSGLMASLFTHGIALPHIIASGDRDLIDRYAKPTFAGELIGALAITEPNGGSDVANLRTTAVRHGDHYVLNGAKTFITSSTRADFVVTAARTGGPGYQGISLIVVPTDTPGFEVTRSLRKMGWHCSDTGELSYTDVRVPVSQLVGEEGSGFIQIAQAFVSERLGLALHGYGIAGRALELTVDYCKQREAFGKAVIDNQVVRHKLVEMHRAVDVARTYAREIYVRYAAGENPLVEALHAKALGVEASRFVTDEAVQLHGGTGYMHGIEVERHYRDQRILGIGGGATEVLDDLTAKLLGYGSIR